MSIVNAIPSVWAAAILKALETVLVYGNPLIINRDYEGEISSYGDSVRIVTVGDVDVKDFTRNTDIDPPQELTDAELTLLIDAAKYFNFQVDDVDAFQMRPDLMAEAALRAAYGLRKAQDTYIAAKYTEIAAGNFLGSDGVPIVGFSADEKKAYQQLTKLKTKLDNTDTPEDDRWAVVPTWYEEYLLNDSRFVGFGTAANRRALEVGRINGEMSPVAATNGLIGQAAGFWIFRSNQVPNVAGAKHKIIAGHRSAWSAADQILETEAYRPERRFADALKGLHVYGSKVIRPSNLACLVASDA